MTDPLDICAHRRMKLTATATVMFVSSVLGVCKLVCVCVSVQICLTLRLRKSIDLFHTVSLYTSSIVDLFSFKLCVYIHMYVM